MKNLLLAGNHGESRKCGGESGVTVVETALILALLFLILFGILEFSVLMFNKLVITNASREGARFATMFDVDTTSDYVYSPKTDTEITQRVQDYASGHLVNFSGSTTPTITITPDWATRQAGGSGTLVEVTVSYPFNFLVLPNFATALAGGTTLTTRTEMRME